jgi:hypothetical protein
VRVVAILERRPEDGAVEPLARVFVPTAGGPAIAVAADEHYATYVEGLLASGVIGPAGRRLFLSDGEAFLEALPDAMRGSRLWAETLREGGGG